MDWHFLMNNVCKCLRTSLNSTAFLLVHCSRDFSWKPCPSCLVEDRNSLGVVSHTRRICDQVLSLAAAFECGLASSLHRWASTVHTPHTAASSLCCWLCTWRSVQTYQWLPWLPKSAHQHCLECPSIFPHRRMECSINFPGAICGTTTYTKANIQWNMV